MHRTEGEDNLANLFTDGPLGTVLEEDWLNAVQEELAYVIEQAGITLKTAGTETSTQLLEALGKPLVLWPAYTSTMTGNETFTYVGGIDRKYLLTPNGAHRNFDPSGTFPAGYEAVVVNVGGPHNIVFDSVTLAAVVAAGTIGRFVYTGSLWI